MIQQDMNNESPTKAEKARKLFLSGHNCAQAVFLAFSKELGLDEQTALKLSSGFGGGMGRLREVCGAVSGMFMVLGMKYGSADPTDQKTKAQLYARIQQLASQFKEENGSIICRELLSLPPGPQDPTPQERTPAYYKVRPCPEKVACAAGLLEKYLHENP